MPVHLSVLHWYFFYNVCTPAWTTPILAVQHLYACMVLHNNWCTTPVHQSVLHQHLVYYTCTPVCTAPTWAVLQLYNICILVCNTPVHQSVLHLYTCQYYTDTCCTTHVHLPVLHRYMLYYTCSPVCNTRIPAEGCSLQFIPCFQGLLWQLKLSGWEILEYLTIWQVNISLYQHINIYLTKTSTNSV